MSKTSVSLKTSSDVPPNMGFYLVFHRAGIRGHSLMKNGSKHASRDPWAFAFSKENPSSSVGYSALCTVSRRSQDGQRQHQDGQKTLHDQPKAQQTRR
eukprot:2870559-Pyramimonas_sp.AAC.1